MSAPTQQVGRVEYHPCSISCIGPSFSDQFNVNLVNANTGGVLVANITIYVTRFNNKLNFYIPQISGTNVATASYLQLVGPWPTSVQSSPGVVSTIGVAFVSYNAAPQQLAAMQLHPAFPVPYVVVADLTGGCPASQTFTVPQTTLTYFTTP